MKKINIAYWTFTGLFAFMMLGSAIPDILSVPMAQEGFRKMGYPTYLLPFIGVAKALGVIAILVPGFPRIREWAYAGLVFDLLGATYSLMNTPNPDGHWSFMFIPLFLAAGSYYFYHRRLKIKAANASHKTRSFDPSMAAVAMG